ncbi:hypothetical protein GALMADRAFT_216815 [Galerina marginata CBS 339.88]|uniref:Uncharacterized protein n=1 Tax=Galerina marginata (strain CBS 339.88) TaxID=685588 RepID=A0A067SIV8_GALM3|nr:hypothetical protein GALMADRAFT_216815 [Galerina marginata CBS 339.88]
MAGGAHGKSFPALSFTITDQLRPARPRMFPSKDGDKPSKLVAASVLRFGINDVPASQVIIIMGKAAANSAIGCAMMDLPRTGTVRCRPGERTLLAKSKMLDQLGDLETNFSWVDRVTKQLPTGHIISLFIRPGILTEYHAYLEVTAPTPIPNLEILPTAGRFLTPMAPFLRLDIKFYQINTDSLSFLPTNHWEKRGIGYGEVTMTWTPSREEASALVVVPLNICIPWESPACPSSLFIVLHASVTGVSFEFCQANADESTRSRVQSLYLHDQNHPTHVLDGEEVFVSPALAERGLTGYATRMKVEARPPLLIEDSKQHHMWLSFLKEAQTPSDYRL